MKVPPLNLTPDINRVGMALPFSPDLLWRYPLSLPQSASPSSPMLDVKNQMPTHLGEWLRGFQRRDLFFGGDFEDYEDFVFIRVCGLGEIFVWLVDLVFEERVVPFVFLFGFVDLCCGGLP